jgi:hypothetical protein
MRGFIRYFMKYPNNISPWLAHLMAVMAWLRYYLPRGFRRPRVTAESLSKAAAA